MRNKVAGVEQLADRLVRISGVAPYHGFDDIRLLKFVTSSKNRARHLAAP